MLLGIVFAQPSFSLHDNVHPKRRRTVRTQEMIYVVRQKIEKDPNVQKVDLDDDEIPVKRDR